MSTNKTYAVMGLGRYGMSVAKELVESGIEVIAIDKNFDIVNTASTEIPICKSADVTDMEALKQLGIANVDVVIIAMATSLEASVMATMLCKELGIKTIVVKCASEMHCKILSRVGADRTVFPENESGIRLAKNLLSSNFIDTVELANDISIVELNVKEEWLNKSLKELNLRKRYSINVVAIIKDESVIVDINPELPLSKDLKLVIIANKDALKALSE